jgi:hypothetical protein
MPETVKSELFPSAVGIEIAWPVKFLGIFLRPPCTATETLVGKEAIKAVDPYNTESGIEEAEIPTILLSEASSAREAMLLLTSIYETIGAFDGGSVMVGDADEVWYIENHSGKQYIAVRLNEEVMFVCPNISVIGLVDLKDTENVAASAGLIGTAVRAGTFAGDAEAGLIEEVIPDPKDIVFYAVLMEKSKDEEAYLVTGNLKHFPMRTYIVTPKEMLDILQEAR